jgi:hypothetical protein
MGDAWTSPVNPGEPRGVLLSAGATEQQAVTDVGGRLIATVTAGDGAVIGLLQNP